MMMMSLFHAVLCPAVTSKLKRSQQKVLHVMTTTALASPNWISLDVALLHRSIWLWANC